MAAEAREQVLDLEAALGRTQTEVRGEHAQPRAAKIEQGINRAARPGTLRSRRCTWSSAARVSSASPYSPAALVSVGPAIARIPVSAVRSSSIATLP